MIRNSRYGTNRTSGTTESRKRLAEMTAHSQYRGLRVRGRSAVATLLFAWTLSTPLVTSTWGVIGPGTQGARASTAADRDDRRALAHLPGGREIAVEIADTPQSRMRGYMYRQEVGENDGMIFVFPEPSFHPFWMKNTLVPLDMIWMDENFKVLYVEASAPPCKSNPCPTYGPMHKASYVLEFQGGTAARENIVVGSRIPVTFSHSR
jgi:uncharacterized membrane protein (UPF0127 family)